MIITQSAKAPFDFTPLFTAVAEELGVKEDCSVELLFVGEKRIRDVNREFRGVDKVTDVLSFPSLNLRAGELPQKTDDPFAVDEDGRLFLGSLMVCTKRCKQQAKTYGHSEEREFFYLICHGMLHLLGYDHMTDEDKTLMRSVEERIMKRIRLER